MNTTMAPMTDFLLATISVTLAAAWLHHATPFPTVAWVMLWLAAQGGVIWYWWWT
jgi:hypothetical protein